MLADSPIRSQIQATRMKDKPKRDGADNIIDRYLPNATPDQREEARYNLQRLARLIIPVQDRLAREAWEAKKKAAGATPEE